MRRVATGASVGGGLGAAIGALYGTYEAFRYQVPGLYKIRYVGQTTVSSAAVSAGPMPPHVVSCSRGFRPTRESDTEFFCVLFVSLLGVHRVGLFWHKLQIFGLFLGAGSFLQCGRSAGGY